MNSYNSIKKIQYTSLNVDEPVSLVEYIEFKDDRNEQKYAILKFKNKISQRLFKISFNVTSYDENNNLLEKSLISYSSLNVSENDTFVPNAKLKLDYNTARISVDLQYARFETSEYRDGKFSHAQFTFNEYVDQVTKDVESKKTVKEETLKEPKQEKVSKTRKKSKKKNKKIIYFKDITDINKSKVPAVFTILFTVLVTVATIASVLTVSNRASWFTVGDFDYQVIDNNCVKVVNYHGDDKNIEIPFIANGKKVVEIDSKVFTNNDNIIDVKFLDGQKDFDLTTHEPLIIDTEAFMDCDNLKSITSERRALQFSEYSFAKCESLQIINTPFAVLNKDAFLNCTNVASITCSEIRTDNFNQIFNRYCEANDNYYISKLGKVSMNIDFKPIDEKSFFGQYDFKHNVIYRDVIE